MDYEDIDKIVFGSPSATHAFVGKITEKEHWLTVMKMLKQPAGAFERIREEFFAGDMIDHTLVEFIRSLRGKYKTCLISNAFDDLREYIVREKFDDAFDHMIISAEVKVAKPEARIYHMALEQLGVSPNEAVFVDDFIENIEACEKLGIHGVHFKDTESAIQRVKELL